MQYENNHVRCSWSRKGTQADKICAKYNIPHISTGDIFRANIKNNTELGQKAKSYMDKGELVPDELVVDLVVDRIKADDCTNGYVLDGFPRTIPQAEALDAALAAINDKVDYAINVEVPDENIINRMSGRRACVACGATYHIVHIPTKVEGVCDKCGADLILRDDDKPETVKIVLMYIMSRHSLLLITIQLKMFFMKLMELKRWKMYFHQSSQF